MNWESVEGKWKQLKGSVRSEWGKLTDDDVEVIAGKRDMLLGKLQERYGYAKDEAIRAIDTFVAKLDSDPADREGAPEGDNSRKFRAWFGARPCFTPARRYGGSPTRSHPHESRSRLGRR